MLPRSSFVNRLAPSVPWSAGTSSVIQVVPGKWNIVSFLRRIMQHLQTIYFNKSTLSLNRSGSGNSIKSHFKLLFPRRWMTLYPRPIPREMRQNLFRSVEDIPPPHGNLSSDIFISDVKSIASYNWLYRKHPVILVPGRPQMSV